MFVLAIILAIITVICALVLPTKFEVPQKQPEQRYGSPAPEPLPPLVYNLKKVTFIPLVLTLVFLLLSSLTVVGTQAIGVPTSFGKTLGHTYGAGLHMKAPWVKVTDIDGTIQTEEDIHNNCIRVKIADGGTACVWVSYRWRINKNHGDRAFRDFRKNKDGILGGIREAMVTTNVKASINEVFGKFEPLSGAVITADMTPSEIAKVKINVVPDTEQFDADVQAAVDRKVSKLGGLIDIESVTISFVDLPETTQARINKFNATVQDTKTALQEIAIKAAQAEANRKLASSLKDPNVLVSKCLDGLISGEITNVAGFNCWPGAGGAVVVPSK